LPTTTVDDVTGVVGEIVIVVVWGELGEPEVVGVVAPVGDGEETAVVLLLELQADNSRPPAIKMVRNK
jgi:hypothetical protein